MIYSKDRNVFGLLQFYKINLLGALIVGQSEI